MAFWNKHKSKYIRDEGSDPYTHFTTREFTALALGFFTIGVSVTLFIVWGF